LTFQPAELLDLNSWSVLRYYSKVNLVFGGKTTVDGIEVVELNWDSQDLPPGQSARKGTLFVAPDFGYAVVRSERMLRPKPGFDWKPQIQVDNRDFVRRGPLWLPSKSHYSKHSYYDDGGYELDQEYTVDFSDCVVNQPHRPETFQIEFPSGTLVTDRIKGGPSYVNKKISDKSIGDQVTEVKKLQAARETSPQGEDGGASQTGPLGIGWWIVAGAGACLLAISALLWIRRSSFH
jgi:hypothetical protein